MTDIEENNGELQIFWVDGFGGGSCGIVRRLLMVLLILINVVFSCYLVYKPEVASKLLGEHDMGFTVVAGVNKC